MTRFHDGKRALQPRAQLGYGIEDGRRFSLAGAAVESHQQYTCGRAPARIDQSSEIEVLDNEHSLLLES